MITWANYLMTCFIKTAMKLNKSFQFDANFGFSSTKKLKTFLFLCAAMADRAFHKHTHITEKNADNFIGFDIFFFGSE
jgi:hypothetical protein